MIDTDIDPPHIGCLVIYAVKNRFPQVLVDEIIDANPFWLALGAPFLAPILEVTHPLFLLRIHRDDRVSTFLERPDTGVDVGKLCVAVGM